ncbi:MAG: aminotransferase class I/II-fold pyridoxal phosphate-dependent enzyme [bacterium]
MNTKGVFPFAEGAYRRAPAPAGALRLDANEGPASGRPWTWPDAEALRRYPDASFLEREIAGRFGLDPARVLVTAGADDAIDRLCRRFLGPGRDLVLSEPTFEMFLRYAALAGAEARSVPWWDGPYPVEGIAALCGPRTGMLAVVSPNNPTGGMVTWTELVELRRRCPGIPLVLDAAYAEYATEDLTAKALDLEDTVVLRTFSKAWGLAALRVGYALGPADLIAELRACGPPYAVSGPSLALAGQALAADGPGMREGAERARAYRASIAGLMGELGLEALPSQANFVLARDPRAGWITAALSALGFVVRGWPGHPLLGDCLRVTCPTTPEDQGRFALALQTVLAPEALLLDLDGVIADEGGSYREAILAVLESFGVRASRQDVAAAKAAGSAANDWDVTCTLLRQAGLAPDRDEVVDRFQRAYLGGDGTPGLCAQETLIPPRWVIEDLARRLPLGIVTGRPRAEAFAFLERFDLSGLFGVVVGMEDAPAKPDPAPVRLALRRLGAQRAWMVGDTPDDLRAARAAGVLPLAVRPPDPRDAPGEDALVEAGAACILSNLTGLRELLK